MYLCKATEFMLGVERYHRTLLEKYGPALPPGVRYARAAPDG